MAEGFKASSIQRLRTRLKRIPDTGDNLVRKAMHEATGLVRGEAVTSIQRGNKTGELYTKYNPKRQHQASAAGEAPATDTGLLVSSITSNVKQSGTTLIGQIIASTEYAPALEFGTTKMAARPFMQPALDKNRKKINQKFKGKYIK